MKLFATQGRANTRLNKIKEIYLLLIFVTQVPLKTFTYIRKITRATFILRRYKSFYNVNKGNTLSFSLKKRN